MFQQYCLWLVGVASLVIFCESTVLRKYLLPSTREADFPATKAAHLGLKVISYKMKNLLVCWIYSVVENPRRVWMPGKGIGYETSSSTLHLFLTEVMSATLLLLLRGKLSFGAAAKCSG